MNRLLLFTSLLILYTMWGCGDGKPPKVQEQHEQDSLSRLNDKVVGLAEIQPDKKIISLYARTGGTVARVFHDMGDTVKKGELIAVLNTEIELSQLDQARSKIGTQEAVIGNSTAQLSSLLVKSANADENYNRNAELIKSGGVTRQDLDNSRFSAESARHDVQAAQEAVRQAGSKLKELKIDIAYSETILEQKKIRAPYDGTILSFNMKVGNSLTASQPLGDFAPAGHLIAVTEVDEMYAQRVKVGMTACIRPQGKSDTLATGKVFLLAPYLNKKSLFSDGATNMEDRRVREVRILLDSGARVLIGNRVDCIIKDN